MIPTRKVEISSLNNALHSLVSLLPTMRKPYGLAIDVLAAVT